MSDLSEFFKTVSVSKVTKVAEPAPIVENAAAKASLSWIEVK